MQLTAKLLSVALLVASQLSTATAAVLPRGDLSADRNCDHGMCCPACVAETAATDAYRPKCVPGWCGTPFCPSECPPGPGDVDVVLPREETIADNKCTPGWCGHDFCDPFCQPGTGFDDLVHPREEPVAEKKCIQFWCGAPFCSPECMPGTG